MLSGSAAQLRAKLQTKTRYLPTAAVAKILPAGAASLEHVPRLQQFNASDSRLATEEYVQAIRKVARVFGRFHHTQETLAEHDTYMVWVAAWAQISGFGEYVVIDESCKAGDHSFVQPARDESGAPKVMLPEMLTGMLLEYVVGVFSLTASGLLLRYVVTNSSLLRSALGRPTCGT